MRVYLPCTLPLLRRAAEVGVIGPVDPPAEGGPRGHAVTPAVREWYTGGDEEDLEYAAFGDAARAALDLLVGDADAPPRRVVLAVDAAEATPDPTTGRSAVRLAAPVPMSLLAAVHVDEVTAEPAVRAARAALARAPDSEESAAAVETVTDHELLWFAPQELSAVISE